MHGSNSRRGAKHPAFRHGRFAKDDPLAGLLNFGPEVIRLTIFLFPRPALEMPLETRGEALGRHIVYEADLTVGSARNLPDDELSRILRRVRRFLTRQLAELRERRDGEAATG